MNFCRTRTEVHDGSLMDSETENLAFPKTKLSTSFSQGNAPIQITRKAFSSHCGRWSHVSGITRTQIGKSHSNYYLNKRVNNP